MSLLSYLFGRNSKQKDVIKTIKKHELKEILKTKTIQLVDVRTPTEYKKGHIKKALNINFFNQNQFVSEFKKMNKETPIYIYCRSGNRSSKAAKQLADLGFKNIYDLKQGYMNWE